MAHIDLNPETGLIELHTQWTEKEMCKSIPGSRWNGQRWTLPLAFTSCMIARSMFGKTMTVGPTLNDWAVNELGTRINPVLSLRELLEVPDFDASTGLYNFQEVGVRYLTTARNAGLFDEMGTGKTVQCVVALRRLGQVESLPGLVICPNTVKYSWQKHILEWFPEALPVLLDGSGARKEALLERYKNKPNVIFIVNIEAIRLHSRLAPYSSIALARCRECDTSRGKAGLAPSRCEVHPKSLNTIAFKTVIFDEAHRMKDPKSKQTRAAWAIMHGPTVQYRWALTGTPIGNTPADLWSILHGLSRDDFPTRSKFIDRYCIVSFGSFNSGMQILGLNPGFSDEFHRIINPFNRRMLKAVVAPQLPPKIRIVRDISMSPKQAKAYDDMDQFLITRIESAGNDAFLRAGGNLARRVRLLQLASAYAHVETLIDDTLRVTLCEPSPKIDALVELLEELGESEPLVFAAESRQLIELAAKRLDKVGITNVLITGKVTQWERDDNLRQFNDGKVRVLGYTIKAGGTGLTMTRSRHLAYLQRSDSMIDNIQSDARVHRFGAEHHDVITFHDFITRGTIEEDQIRIIVDKLHRLDEITRDRERLVSLGLSTDEIDAESDIIMRLNLANVPELQNV